MANYPDHSEQYYRTNTREVATRSMGTRDIARPDERKDDRSTQRAVATVFKPCLQRIAATREIEVRELGLHILHAMSTQSASDAQDWMPIIAQLKSLFQVMTGDVEGARQTQERFLQAWQTAKLDILYAILDGTPLVGHVKGLVHYSLGQGEAGDQAMKAASRTVAVIGAGFAGGCASGPYGAAFAAIGAGAAYDGMTTTIESARDGKLRANGAVSAITTIASDVQRGEHPGGSIADLLIIVAGDAMMGKTGVRLHRNMRTTKIYRVEAAEGKHSRMETCPAGQLVIRDRKALFVNVESKFRATTFMAKRLKQYPKSESRLKSIRLKGNWKNELATIAVPEGLFKGNRVSTVDIAYPRQYGIRWEAFNAMPADYVKGSFKAATPNLMSKIWSRLVVKPNGDLSPTFQVRYGYCRRWVSPCVREGAGHCRNASKQVTGDCIYSVEYGQMHTEEVKIMAITSCRRKIIYADGSGEILTDGWEFEVNCGGVSLWLPLALLNEEQVEKFIQERLNNSQEVAQILSDRGDWLQVEFMNGDVRSLPARDIWIEEHETSDEAASDEFYNAAVNAMEDLGRSDA